MHGFVFQSSNKGYSGSITYLPNKLRLTRNAAAATTTAAAVGESTAVWHPSAVRGRRSSAGGGRQALAEPNKPGK